MSDLGEKNQITSATISTAVQHKPRSNDADVSEKKKVDQKTCEENKNIANKKGKLKSDVWDHFNKLKCENPTDQRATCKYCEKSLACPAANGTSSLRNHLLRCKRYPPNIDKNQKVLAMQPCPRFSDSLQYSLVPWSFDQGYCRKMLAIMIIVDELSFRHAEHEGFRDFCHAMQPKFIIPKRHAIARDRLDVYMEEMFRIRDAVKYVRSSLARLQRFKLAIEQEKIECKALVFYETTLKLSGSLYVTGNEYAKQIFGLGIMISEWCTSADVNLQAMAKKMKLKHDKYWKNIENVNIMLFIAVALDPRCKLDYVDLMIERFYDGINVVVLKNKVKIVLTSMFETYSLAILDSQPNASDKVESVGSQVVDSGSMSASAFMDTMFSKKRKVSELSGCQKHEFEKYLSDEHENLDDPAFEILCWWKENSSKYKVLSMIARETLAMPVSTVASESAFSTGGRVLDSFRSSLSPRTVEALVCAQDWIRANHISIEQNLEQIELTDLELSCSTEDHPLLSIDD